MNSWIHVTGWALIHFVWQGALIALATAAALRLTRRQPAETRYGIACIALLSMLAAATATAALVWASSSFPESSAVSGVLASELTHSSPRIATHGMRVLPAGAARAVGRVDAWLPFVVWGWMFGVTCLLARFAGGCWRIHRLRMTTVQHAVSPWQSVAERLARRLRMLVPLRVVESRVVDAPIVIGWIRPVILLPVAILVNMAPDHVEALLAHELAHIRRRDYAVNLVQSFAEALLFFHPAVWWVSARIREEREHCCDDAAVEACGGAMAYAEALAELASGRGREAALSVAASGGSLLARIRRLLCAADEHQPRAIGGVVALTLAIAGASALAVISPPSLFATRAQTALAGQRSTGEQRIHHTDHFEIHYPPELDLHAERVAREAERAYERVSGDLRHNLAFKIPIVLFRTTQDLEQSVRTARVGQPDGASVAEPSRARILLAVDRPAAEWAGVITHEVAHIFGFDILPGTSTPRWILEGLAEYQRGEWDPNDLVALRDVVRANAVPKMSRLQGDDSGNRPRLITGLGHAAFEFIESRWGKPGVRQFLLALRQSSQTGADPYQAAFHSRADEFDEAFELYLAQRFARTRARPLAERFDDEATLNIEGTVTALHATASANLACIEIWVPSDREPGKRWAIECGDQSPQDLLRALKPGDLVVVTGAPAREPESQRVLVQQLRRPSDGFTWRSSSG